MLRCSLQYTVLTDICLHQNLGNDVVLANQKSPPPYNIQFESETLKSQSITTDGRRKYEDYILVSNIQSLKFGYAQIHCFKLLM